MYGNGEPDDRTVRFEGDQADVTRADLTVRADPADVTRADPTVRTDPADVTRADLTVRIDPRDDPTGYTEPQYQRTTVDPGGVDRTTVDPGMSLPTAYVPVPVQPGPTPLPSVSVPPTSVPAQSVAAHSVPPTSVSGRSVPAQSVQPQSLPPTSLAPAPLPQRVPGRVETPPTGSGGGSGGSGTGSRTGTSIRIGKGVVPTALPRTGDRTSRTRIFLGRATRVLSAIATLVLIAAAVWTGWQWWERLHNKVMVSSVAVAPAQLFDGKCNVQFDIVGTITTNGKAGTISYQWLRSDGQNSGTLTQTVASGQTSTAVHLYWKFTGEGSMNASATLHVLTPTVTDGSTRFRYSCA